MGTQEALSLINRSPQIMMLAVDLDKDFINIEGITIASMLPLQSAGINRSEFDTPEPDRLSADSDTSLGEQVFNISVAEIESIVEQDCVGNDLRWESVTLVSSYPPILSKSAC
jgi:hypothetical protein